MLSNALIQKGLRRKLSDHFLHVDLLSNALIQKGLRLLAAFDYGVLESPTVWLCLARVMATCRLRGAGAVDLLARAISAARLGLPAPALPPIAPHLLGRNGALMGI